MSVLGGNLQGKIVLAASVFAHDEANANLVNFASHPLLVLELAKEPVMLLCQGRQFLP